MRARSSPAGLGAGGGRRSGSSAGRSTGWPRIGRSTSITSAASVTSVAPCLSRLVGAFRARIERRARHREHLAALFERHPRGDQRAGALRRLDHHDAERKAGNQPVAAGKIARARLPADRHFGDRGAFGRMASARPACSARIDAVMAAGEHRDRAGREARAMRGGIDAARETRDDDEAGVAEIARQPLGEPHAGRRGIARADDRDHRQGERRGVAAHRKQRRRVVDHLQAQRIVRLADATRRDAERLRGLDLALGVLRASRCGRDGTRRRAAPDRAARRAPRARRRSD